jgi:hypothetical protein
VPVCGGQQRFIRDRVLLNLRQDANTSPLLQK